MRCDQHGERLYEPVVGEPYCLGHVVDHIVLTLGLDEEVAEKFRAWAFDGAEHDDQHDALERHERAVQLYRRPASALTEFWQQHPAKMKSAVVQKTQDLVILLDGATRLARSALDRDSFKVALSRTRELLTVLEAA